VGDGCSSWTNGLCSRLYKSKRRRHVFGHLRSFRSCFLCFVRVPRTNLHVALQHLGNLRAQPSRSTTKLQGGTGLAAVRGPQPPRARATGIFLVFLLSLGQLRPAPSGRDLRARLAPPKASSETERSALRVSYNPATRILFNFFSRSGERTGAGGGGGAEADNDHVRFRIHYEIPLGPLTPRPPW
jgi:hypothetical protein